LAGFESAQLQNEEAVKRHFCLSCVAQSVLQQASCSGKKSARFSFAQENEHPIDQRLYPLTRESMQQLVELTQHLLAQNHVEWAVLLSVQGC